MRRFYTDRQTDTHTDRLAQTGYLIVHRRKLFVGDKNIIQSQLHPAEIDLEAEWTIALVQSIHSIASKDVGVKQQVSEQLTKRN